MSFTLKELDCTMDAEQDKGAGKLNLMRKWKLTPFSAFPELCSVLLGGFAVYGGRIVHVPPRPHPWFPWARCNKVSCKPWDVLAGSVPTVFGSDALNRIHLSNHGEVTATYTLPDNDQVAEDKAEGEGNEEQELDICSEAWDYGYQLLTLPNQYLKWKSTNVQIRPDELNAYITQPYIQVQVIRHRVLKKPVNSIMALMGKINQSQMRLVADYFPAETVKFDGLTANRRITTAKGLKFYELGYKFIIIGNYGLCQDLADLANPTGIKTYAGWNRAFNPAVNAYDRMVWAANPTKGAYLLDGDSWGQTIGGRLVPGFSTLFHPLAS